MEMSGLYRSSIFFLLMSLCLAARADQPARHWVTFSDRGYHSETDLNEAVKREVDLLLPATRDRLLKVRPADALARHAT